MRRALGLGLLLAALAATPAGAVVPPPRVVNFEGVENPDTGDVRFQGAECSARIAGPGGSDGGQYVFSPACQPTGITMTFLRETQASVSFFLRLSQVPSLRASAAQQAAVSVVARDANGNAVAEQAVTPPFGTWEPVRLRLPGAVIQSVEVFAASIDYELGLDEVGFSPFAQPDVEMTGGPGSGEPTFTFEGQPGMTFTCRLDTGPAESCTSPKAYPGLADGGHTFEVVGTDRWGGSDSASQRFVVSRPVADRDFDGILDGSDNCPDAANAGQGDSDSDGVGDACEVLPSGNLPIEAGKAAKVKLLSGEVFVRLPPGASASAFTSGLRVPFQSSGFLPLKGVAAVPMGSTLDTRRGEVSITAAVNGQRPTSRRQLRREARFRAGIFAIRQARKARKAKRSKRIPPRAELASPAGAEAPCRASGPAKGVAVRSLSTTAKGVFRTVGGAATATPAKGTTTFITTDRCDGTVTEVGRGRVAVIAKRSGKRRVVRAGRAYIVRARLFAARKGRERP